MSCNKEKTRNNKDYRENQSEVEMDGKKSLKMGPRTGKVKVVNVQIAKGVGGWLSRGMGDRYVMVEPFQNQNQELLCGKVWGEEGKDTELCHDIIILFLEYQTKELQSFSQAVLYFF